MKGETDSNTIILGDFNIPFSIRDRLSRQKISKETVNLNNTIDQIYLTDIYTTFHPRAEEYTCFSSAQRIFLRIDPMLDHKTSLKKLKKIEIIPSIFSDHNGLKLEIRKKEKRENSQICGN